jgi:uncharacterized protein YegP (UPF0339 family)
MTTTNHWKTSDIKISKDSVGCYTATHKYAGTLIDGNFYNSRAECRRDAVEELKSLKEEECR